MSRAFPPPSSLPDAASREAENASGRCESGRHKPDAVLAGTNHEAAQARMLGAVRILFGLMFLVNLALHFNLAYAENFLPDMLRVSHAAGQPAWLGIWADQVAAVFRIVGPGRALALMFGLETLLALGLLTGMGFPALGWVGIAYELFLWATIGGIGGPYTAGATDPGTAIAYALVFGLILLMRAWQGLSWTSTPIQPISRDRMRLAFTLFGTLWTFDAWWKWQPAFLLQFAGIFSTAQAGQPSWLASWIGIVLSIIHMIGPYPAAFLVAVIESGLAAGMLFSHYIPKKALCAVLLSGFVYSFALWTSAEAFGGPYGAGFTGNRGDVLGTANIYALIFLLLMAAIWAQPSSALARGNKVHADSANGSLR